MNEYFVKYFLFGALLICAFYVIGLMVLKIFRLKKIEKIHHAISPTLGLATLALQLWLYGLVNIPWDRLTLFGPWLIVLITLYIRNRKSYGLSALATVAKNTRNNVTKFLKNTDFLSCMFIVLCIIIGLAYWSRMIMEPIMSADTLAFWGYKAKEFFTHQSVYVDPWLNRSPEIARFFHIDYPPLLPLMSNVTYVAVGHIQEVFLKCINVVFMISGATAILCYMKSRLLKNESYIAYMTMFLLFAAPQFMPFLFQTKYLGFADYPIAIFMLLSTIFFLRSTRSNLIADTALSLFFASMAGVTKNDGMPFLLIIMSLIALRQIMTGVSRKSFRKLVIVGLLCLLATLPVVTWSAYRYLHGIPVDFSLSNFANSGMTVRYRLGLIRQFVWAYISTNPPFHWEGWAFIVGGVASFWTRSRESIYVFLMICSVYISYMLSYFFSPYDLKFHVLSSIERLLVQLLPLIVLLIGVNLSSYRKDTKKSIT